MPTDHQDDDKALSDRLQQIEPPKSPSHLDETILKRARQKAEALRETNAVNNWWSGLQWRSAIAVFSVAAVAISVSLQLFNNQELDEAVQFESAQAPAVDSAPRQLQEEVVAEDQGAFAIAQNSAADADVAQALQAPAERAAAAEPARRVETDQATSDAGGRTLARSAATSRTATPAQQGVASSTANFALSSSVGTREQAFDANTVDPALLNLLSAVLLTEQLAETELADAQQSDRVAELLAAFEQLSEEELELAQEQYTERRTVIDNDNIPTALDQALELIRP